MRKLGALLVALVLVASACGDDDDGGEGATATTAGGGGGGGQEYRVVLDGETDAFVGEFPFFFPGNVTVHPGDTVRYEQPNASGVPHTVTLGTLVDQGVAKLEQLGPGASFEAQENAPEVRRLPDIFPHETPQGPPDVNHSAAEPCFLATGEPPGSLTGGAPACAKVPQPEFDGTQSFYNSGALINDGDSFTLKLSDNIRPATYSVICLIHRGAMIGKLTVAPEDGPVPSPSETEAKGREEFDAVVKALTPVAETARRATPDRALMGTGSPQQFQQVTVAEWGPPTVEVPVNGTVNWTGTGFHTLTLEATDADIGVMTRDPAGVVRLNPKLAPAGFNVPPELGEFPFPASSGPVTVDLRYDGSGFRNTGVVGSLPPRIITFKVTFTKAGTYSLRCQVHPDMKGEVKVS